MRDGLKEIQLESARMADAARIAGMSRTHVEGGLAWRWTPRAIAARIRDSESEVLVARKHGKLVGFAVMQFRFSEREAHLLLFAVAPAERRCGLGRKLLAWLEEIARLGGISLIRLELRATNEGGRSFYRALGYEEAGRLRGYYQKREDALRMVLNLRTNAFGRPSLGL
ncbi:MAG: GNAT family N-acetyltransferase [Myxococcota bacterium]